MKRDFSDRCSRSLALPEETISGAPLVRLHGRGRVCVENHGGILEYSQELVRVAVKRGVVCVVGSNMEICRMTRRELEVRGRIQRVEME